MIPSREAWESVKIVTELIICRTARRAVQIAINSALVEDGHIVKAQPNVIFNDGMIQPEPIMGVPSGVLTDASSDPSV